MNKKFQMHPVLLLTLLVATLLCGTAFAYNTGEPPGPSKSLMIASSTTKGPSDIQKTPSIILADANCANCHQNKDASTTAPASQSAIDKHMALALTGPPTVAQQQTYNNFIFLGAAEGAKPGLVAPAPYTNVGLVASGTVIYPKGMYSAYGGSGSEKFTAAAQQTIVTQQISMSVASGKMVAIGFAKDFSGNSRDAPGYQLGGSSAPYYSGLIVPDGA